ncbi:hypothetical protein DUI87_11080 [Hirundo rustica rustica]|uniref:Reverse transcriptase/retrotransposon-derived protein RNase H-like domain-containing protein n=1 Tax=Hirundo rustica rustica TaxID=333673 RepID=A0A3M0KLW1_HIRRU|nr:hypothetical protein DUI87_11080 [Hirundo rustica rustica]
MHFPEYSQIVSPLFLITCKNVFHWGPEQQQAFAQIKQEIAHAVALGPVRTGPDVKNVLSLQLRTMVCPGAFGTNHCPKGGDNGKVPGEMQSQPLGFGVEANYTPTEKEILAAYEGVQAASEVIGREEAQLLLAPQLLVLGWMFKGKAPSTHHATNATWSKWIALMTQHTRIGNSESPWDFGNNYKLAGR